jgi:RNA polymerase sigma-70 factor (ECF subfamily)
MDVTNTVTTHRTVEWTESEAIARAQRGEAAAFEYLYRAHCRYVYDVCLRVAMNAADAEVLTQRVFLQLFRRIGTFRSESDFSTWVRRVTLDIVLMHLNRKKPAEIPAGDLEPHNSGGKDPRGEVSYFRASSICVTSSWPLLESA